MLAAASAAAAATTTSTTQRLGEGLAGTVAAALQGREGELEKRARPYAWCSGMLSLARCVSLLLLVECGEQEPAEPWRPLFRYPLPSSSELRPELEMWFRTE